MQGLFGERRGQLHSSVRRKQRLVSVKRRGGCSTPGGPQSLLAFCDFLSISCHHRAQTCRQLSTLL
uniref:Uncharacterized protein n=1 Tax=Anguilla anguilla TaxID=7936 RepID=A0A0E9XVE4_ANGAN